MPPIRRRAAALAAAALCAPMIAACSGGSDAVDQEAAGQFRFVAGDGTGRVIDAADRREAPRFTGDLLGGGRFDSSSLDGKVAVINFWGQWCVPCRVESPEFQRVYAATKARGVEFLGVNVKDSEQLAEAFLDNKHITYPSVFDPSSKVALRFRDYPPNAIPSTIVLDRHGRVAAVYLKPLFAGDLEPIVTRLAGEKT